MLFLTAAGKQQLDRNYIRVEEKQWSWRVQFLVQELKKGFRVVNLVGIFKPSGQVEY